MWQYNYTPSSDELYHHGIKGQRWGVRRYQNKDGTLTPAGKKRVSKDLYKQMSANQGKLGRNEYGKAVTEKLKDDKRIKDFVNENKEGYKKLFEKFAAAEGDYERRVNELLNKPNNRSDFEIEEYIFNDKKVLDAEKRSQDAFNEIEKYVKKSKPIVDDILGKYKDMPANAFMDTNTKAEDWVYYTIEELMGKD